MKFGPSLGMFTSRVRFDSARTAEASPVHEVALLEAVREAKVLPANFRSLTKRGLSSEVFFVASSLSRGAGAPTACEPAKHAGG